MSIQNYITKAKAVLAAKEAAEREELAQRNAELAARDRGILAGLLAAYPPEVKPYASLFYSQHHGCYMVKFELPDCTQFLFAYFEYANKGVAIHPDEDGKLVSGKGWQPMTFEVAVAYAARQGEE